MSPTRPSPTSTISIADEPNGHGPPDAATRLAEPQPWRLDPLPLILDDHEWAGLEAGLVQRAELLDADTCRPVRPSAAAGPAASSARSHS
jgi:hypothetical protein